MVSEKEYQVDFEKEVSDAWIIDLLFDRAVPPNSPQARRPRRLRRQQKIIGDKQEARRRVWHTSYR